MEEDINILEEKIKEWEPYKNIDFPTKTGKLIQKENQAIENLIKGYRELEKENSKIRDANSKLYEVAQGRAVQEILSDTYIPKSKIKEKIEELESKIKATFCKYMTEEDYYNNKFLSSDVAEDYEVLEVRKLISNRNLLQELMEDK